MLNPIKISANDEKLIMPFFEGTMPEDNQITDILKDLYTKGYVMGDPKRDNFLHTEHGLIPIDFGAVFALDDPNFTQEKKNFVAGAAMEYSDFVQGPLFYVYCGLAEVTIPESIIPNHSNQVWKEHSFFSKSNSSSPKLSLNNQDSNSIEPLTLTMDDDLQMEPLNNIENNDVDRDDDFQIAPLNNIGNDDVDGDDDFQIAPLNNIENDDVDGDDDNQIEALNIEEDVRDYDVEYNTESPTI